jgi:hypothetical protein
MMEPTQHGTEGRHPVIRIRDGWLLRDQVSKHLHELWGKGQPLADDEWMEQRVAAYTAAWQPFETKIMDGLHELTGLRFRQNIVDVYLAPWFNAMSDPLIIGVMREPDEFIDVLTHELIHRLLTDNAALPFETLLVPRWEALFGPDHSFHALIHIPVHALHQAVYLDILDAPHRLERDKTRDRETHSADYVAAWEYVGTQGYKEIIMKLKEDYQRGD